ncbi:MAG: CoA transferase [Chloroflexi bacterium]|nr:CoA transferase [Chloroflexota bacterium]
MSSDATPSRTNGDIPDTPGLNLGYEKVSPSGKAVSRRALSGVRVLEFAVGLVGPFCTSIMAQLGAQVFRIESQGAMDGFRVTRNPLTNERLDFEGVPRYNFVNLSKWGASINMRKAEGLELVKRLISVSDVLLENYSAGVIDRMGLSYEAVREVRPDIIMVSASGSGRVGPEAGSRAVATIFGAVSGLAEMTGYPDDRPHEARSTADAINSLTIFYSIVAALYYRKRTGRGQYIDYSSREGMTCLLGDVLMDYAMNGREQTRQGNRDSAMAPHDCYRCRGEGAWLSIAAGNQAEWEVLVNVMGRPVWAAEDRFSTPLGRWKHQDEMGKLIGAWTLDRDACELMETLQRAGVAAAPSFSCAGVYSDPHIGDREVLEVVEHPKLGANLLVGCPWKLSATPCRIDGHGPLIGQHNKEVFSELLGIPEQEFARLQRERVVW